MAAQGLLGLISYHGQWLAPDAVRAKRNSDAELSKKLEEYNARRAALEVAMTARKHDTTGNRSYALAHEKLGSWCEQSGLKDEAVAHFTTAVQYDPYRDAPWKHLGYVKHHGRWMTHEQIRTEDQEALAQRTADRRWETSLKKGKRSSSRRNGGKRRKSRWRRCRTLERFRRSLASSAGLGDRPVESGDDARRQSTAPRLPRSWPASRS